MLVKQAELDCIQQRQLKEYPPEMHFFARLQTHMAETIFCKDLSNEHKLQLLSSYHSRFDKLQREIGVRSSGPLSSAGYLIAYPTIQAADNGTLSLAPLDLNTNLQQEVKDRNSSSLTQALKMVRKLRVKPQYELKVCNLMVKILDNHNVLKRNHQGKLIINDVV